MSSTLLTTLSMSMQYIWGPRRQLRALLLDVHPEVPAPVDVPLLVRVLDDARRGPTPVLILSTQDAQLMRDLALGVKDDRIWVVLSEELLREDEDFCHLVRKAQKSGTHFVWMGQGNEQPHADFADIYRLQILNLKAEREYAKLMAGTGEPSALPSFPLRPGVVYAGVDNQILLTHCLDTSNCWGVLGWPSKHLAQHYRAESSSPSHSCVVKMIKGLDADASTDQLEALLCRDAILTYRFLRFINSVILGRRNPIDTPRKGLTMVGLSKVRAWLDDQIIGATSNPDLDPIRLQMVLRGLLTERVLDAGVDLELKRELYVCGLLSQIDVLLQEPMSTVLQRIVLPDRVLTAIGGQRGVYWPALDMVAAVESGLSTQVSQRGLVHRISPAQVNKAILNTLGLLSLNTQVDVTV